MAISQLQIDNLISVIQEAKGDLAYKYSIGGLNGIYCKNTEKSILKLDLILNRLLNYNSTYSDSYFYILKKESKDYSGNISIPTRVTPLSPDSQYRIIITLSTGGSGVGINSGFSLPSRRSYNFQNILLIGYNTLTIGDGSKTEECYFSSDSGVTAKYLNTLSSSDVLYLNANVIGFTLATSDQIEITLI